MSLFRSFSGPLTRELVLEPGRFGLGQVPARLQPVALTKGVCGYCSTGCGVQFHLNRDGEAVNLTPDPDYPVNLGMACPKGWEALTPLASPDRGTVPRLDGRPVDWHEAMTAFCERFKAIQSRHGPESVAFISTGQIFMEEMALLGALAKFGMGCIHGDGNTRQCMATSVMAYKECFGFDAPPFTYADFEESDCLVFIGANPCIAHPILWQRVLRNARQPEIIVIDPRKTETAVAATRHVAIAPKEDLRLLYCMAHWLIREGRIKRDFIDAHTAGFDEFAEFVRGFAPEHQLAKTGVPPDEFVRLMECIAGRERVSFWWTMGVNQGHEAVSTAQAIIALALMTGNIGRPGTGANSITGQCNAMGSRLFSNTTNLLGGHDFANPAHREKIAAATGIPAERIPDRGSWAYDQIIEGIHDGRIKGLWVIATNPAHSWINQSYFHEAMEKLDFLVVQDMYAGTETARRAHLYLPAAGWGEKVGCFINSERRIGLSRKARRAPGQALSDFNILRLIAGYWGCADLLHEWSSPEAVFQILKRCSAGQPCDITGIRDYAMLEECGGIQWPLPRDAPAPDSERRLFADGRFFTPEGRARFVWEAPVAAPEPPDAEYPLVLLTGRGSSAQWHTETRTAKSAILRRLHLPGLRAEMHPDDAAAYSVHSGDAVRVRTRRGAVRAMAHVTATVPRGSVYLPMHHPDMNRLTHAVFDPVSRQPSYKYCAAVVERA